MKKISLKSLLLLILVSSGIQSFSQVGAFRVKTGPSINIGFANYRYLTFGQGQTTNHDGPWSIERWDGGLNFWNPWISGVASGSQMGNYRLFLSDNGLCGINMKPGNVNSTNYNQNAEVLQIRGKAKSHAWLTWSDSSLKNDVKPLNSILATLIKLSPVSYYYKSTEISGVPTFDSNEVKNQTIQNEQSRVSSAGTDLRYGFIAQDVSKIYPNLVSIDGGISSVNYVDMVPLLVASVKEQQIIIETLKQEITDLKGKTVYTDVDKTKLFQNDPNPFRGTTNFTYFIDENVSVTNAIIEVRNIMGVIQSTVTLGDKSGLGKATFDSNGLADGYYIYTLKINGSVKDSKMMLIGE
jgi:hypothetical protein